MNNQNKKVSTEHKKSKYFNDLNNIKSMNKPSSSQMAKRSDMK